MSAERPAIAPSETSVSRQTAIRIAAAVLLDDAGCMLVVKKRTSPFFMQPGGKIEAGETPEIALLRELREEVAIAAEAVEPLGVFAAPAANEPDATVFAHIFAARASTPPCVGAEIETLLWIDPDNPGDIALAPLTRDHMLPLARRLAARSRGELR